MFRLSAVHSARQALLKQHLFNAQRYAIPAITRAYATGGSRENVSFLF